MSRWPMVPFGEFLRPNRRPYELGPTEDADLVGMRLYGEGPFHRERKPALQIKKKSHFVIKAGDVIYNKLFAWKGTFGVVPPELDGMFVSDKFPTYEPDPTKIDLGYLKWYFRYAPLWDQSKAYSKGAAALSKLTLNPPDFPKLEIPLPPSIADQRRIAAKLDAVADRVAEAKRHRAAVERETRALLTAAISQVIEALGPTGTLKDVLMSRPRNGWSVKCDGADNGVAVLGLGAITGFRYRADQAKRTSEPTDPNGHYWLRRGDLLISRSNTPELVGHAAIYDGTPSPCIYPDLMMRLPVDPEKCEPKFVHYVLQSRATRDFIKMHAKGTSPTMKKISQGIVEAIPFPTTCSLRDQIGLLTRLDSIAASVESSVAEQRRVAASLDSLLPSVLNRAFLGEL